MAASVTKLLTTLTLHNSSFKESESKNEYLESLVEQALHNPLDCSDPSLLYSELSEYFSNHKKIEKAYNFSVLSMSILDTEEEADKKREKQAKLLLQNSFYKKYEQYNKRNVKNAENLLNAGNVSDLKVVTVTMTSCKRLDLFCKTVNSFLECCTDLLLVKEWLVFDDNSSEEDVETMRKLYPFITLHCKTFEDRGHAKSLNSMIPKITTPFFFHLEDDWTFLYKTNYLTKCLNVLNEDLSYGQCLLNRGYGENLNCHKINTPSERKQTSKGNVCFYEHFYSTDVQEQREKGAGKPNCIYWPHYSLRVGLNRTRLFEHIKNYDERSFVHFEMEFGLKYVNKGFVTTYLDTLFCIHTGRNTSELNDPNSKNFNGYTLNNIPQFGKSPQNVSVVINNLLRRPDRIKKFIEKNEKELRTFNYTIFRSIDGKSLKYTTKLAKLFEPNDFGFRKGIIGCACSIIQECYNFLTEDTKPYLLILEDDGVLASNFYPKMLHAISQTPDEFGILMLGHFPYPNKENPENYNKAKLPEIIKYSTEKCFEESMGGFYGVVMSRKGAKNFLDHINTYGVTNGIDWVLYKSTKTTSIYFCHPHIVFSEYATASNNVDTDIQLDMTRFTLTPEQRVMTDVSFMSKFFKFTVVVDERVGGRKDFEITLPLVEDSLNTEEDFRKECGLRLFDSIITISSMQHNFYVCVLEYSVSMIELIRTFKHIKYVTYDNKYILTIPKCELISGNCSQQFEDYFTFDENFLNTANPIF